jgi:hypothetical protein
MAIGAAVSAGSTLYGGYAQKQQADYQSKVAQNNATIAERKARDAETQGQHERDRLRINAAQLRAKGEVGFAAGNVVLGSGSAKAWDLDVSQGLAVDVANSQANAANRAQGFIDQRQNFLAEASAQKASGRGALIGGALSAGGSLLTGASNFRSAGGFTRAGTLSSINKRIKARTR